MKVAWTTVVGVEALRGEGLEQMTKILYMDMQMEYMRIMRGKEKVRMNPRLLMLAREPVCQQNVDIQNSEPKFAREVFLYNSIQISVLKYKKNTTQV